MARHLILPSILGGLALGAFSWRRRERREVIEQAPGDGEELFRSVLRHGSDIFTILEADGTIRYESPSIERVLGYKPDELVGKVAFDYVHPEDLERVLDAFAEALAEPETARRVEYRFRQADGSWRHLESIGNNLLEGPGVRGVIVVSRDISERKRAEESLRQSEERYRAVVEQSMDGIYLVDAGTKRILETNSSLQRMFGYSAEEFRGMELYELIALPREDVDSSVERTLEERNRFIGERLYRRKDGSLMDVEVGVNTISYSGKEIICAVVRDLTGRKEAEKALKESEKRFRSLVQNASEVILIMEPDETVRYISPAVERVLGYKPDEVVGMPNLTPVHPDDMHLAESLIAEVTKNTGTTATAELRLRHADGSWRCLETRCTNLLDDPSVGGIVFNSRDITERKEAERRLREAESRFRTLVEHLPAAVYAEELSGDGKTLRYMSPRYEEMLGHSPDEGVSHPEHWLKVVHPEDIERVVAEDQRTDETLEPFRVEYRVCASDGRVLWIEDEAVVVRDEEGNPLYWIGVQLDITEQKVAQEALRSSEARFRSVVESIGEGLLITDTDDIVKYANPRMTELTGYAQEELLGRPAYELLLSPEQWQELFERNRGRMAGSTERYEVSLRRKDGDSFRAEITATPFRDASGEVVGTLGTITDITERSRTERALMESEERFRQLFEQSVDAIFVHDEKGRFVDCNSQACRLLGYTREELLDLSVQDVSCSMLTEEERAAKEREGGTLWQRALAGEPGTFTFSHEEENKRRDGTTFPVEVRVGSVDYGGRRLLLTSVRDITERKRAEGALRESEERHRRQAQELSLLYEVSTAVARELDLSVVLRTVVEAVAQTFGYTLVSAYLLEGEALTLQHQVGYEQVIARIPITEGVAGRVARTGRPVLLEDVREDPAFLGAIEGITSEICVPLFDQDEVAGILNVESMGGIALTEADLRLVSALAEQVGGAIGRARLYTRARQSEERLAYRAFHDPLTGLANRALFLNRLEHAQARANRQESELAVLFMDLDNFKVINDSLGHGAGDRLLVAVGERLSTCVRPQDTVARLGGDEFVALLEGLADASAAIRVADRIMEGLREPFEIDDHVLHTSASIGIALSAASGGDLLRAADTAMYHAKGSGKGHYEVFEDTMHDRAMERLRLENDFRVALGRGEFTVHYQPEVELSTGGVTAVEALLRWWHPEYGLLSPSDFMPMAEQTALIVPIGRWVLLETCRQARAWQERRPNDAPPLACVNLSVTQLQHTDFVVEVLEETGLDPARLVLEITEDAVMDDAQSAIAALESLKGSGIKLAIDDFGTGYSSLSYLRRLPVDFLKIDRSFVERLEEDPKDVEIVAGTIDLAHTLGLKVIAEGVETAAQLDLLREMECDLAQGNYFSEPLDAASLDRYLEGN